MLRDRILRMPEGPAGGGNSAGGGGASAPAPSSAAPASPAPSGPTTSPPPSGPSASAPGGSSAPAAPPGPGTPPPRNTTAQTLSPEVLRILGFDPGDTAPPASPPAGAAPPAPGAQPAQPAEPAAPSPSGNGLDAAALALQQSAAALRDAAARPGQPAQPSGPPIEQVELPDYTYGFPDGLVNLLRSEKPEENLLGLREIAKGVSQTVHRNAVVAMRYELARIMPNMIQHYIRESSQRQQVVTDFYGAYPEFNNPAIRPTVFALAQQIAAEKNWQAWTPEFREELAGRMRTLLAGFAPRQGNGNPPPPPPNFTGGGARPGTPSGGQSITQEIMSLA